MLYKIHKEGYKILIGLLIILLIINAIRMVTAIISLISFLFTLSFFRIPLWRMITNDEGGKIIAPADGKIVVIEEVQESEYFNDKRIQVSIFMSPANVHVNRNPVSGKVAYTKYHPGNYLVAWHPKSSELNERFTTVIKDEFNDMEIMVRQIAGKLARKISNYLDEGQEVEQGTELGFIKFGSRVDLFLPVGSKICINLQQKVKGGSTVIAEL
ncbi:UNVERIFIED_CONTAM: hypothetical protein GTU68_018095 [Idotea baltica]|nr:hypothetical protein [Idotea baltica]